MRGRNFLKTSLGTAGAALTLRSLPPALSFAGAGPLALGPAPGPDVGHGKLRQAFENPPNDNRNWTRWWWFGPQASEQGIAYELEQIHKQGLGGVEMQWMTPRELEGNFRFLSERWAQTDRISRSLGGVGWGRWLAQCGTRTP